jgi:hypothetical protein
MASPMGLLGVGASVASGLIGAAGAKTGEAAQQLNIRGQLMTALGQAYGMDVAGTQYDYQANINKYQAAVAKMNEDLAHQNAAYSRDVGEDEAQQVAMKHEAERGEMIATQGASGIDVNVGSSIRVRESMIDLGYYDEAITRASAAKKAYGYEVEATMNEAQADIYRYTAKMNEDQAVTSRTAADYTRRTATGFAGAASDIASRAGTIGVVGSLVSATGSVASKWIQGGGVGMFNAS